MRAFRDTSGREWILSITVTTMRRVKALLKIDLYALVKDGFQGLSVLLGNPMELVDVLYVLCRDEAISRDVSDEQFGQAFSGDVLSAAADAILEELIDFFPDPRVREQMRQMTAKGKATRDKVLTYAAMEVEKIDPEVEAKRLISSFGNSLVLSASTRAPSL